MSQTLASGFFGQHTRLIVFTALSSLALSIWCIWADPIVNNDGTYYFRAAEKISIGDWKAALSIYSWPFYPALISLLAKLIGGDVVLAAYLLNSALAVAVVVGFLSVVYELGGDRKTLLFAALVILAFPTLNKFRSFIIRDIGYLAFYLWALSFLFRYWKDRAGADLLGWFLCTMVTILFRVEGVALLAAVPAFIYGFGTDTSRKKWIMITIYLLVGTVLLLLLGMWLFRDSLLSGSSGAIAGFGDLISGVGDQIRSMAGGKLAVIKEHLTDRYALPVYVLAIVFVTLAEVVRRLAVIYALLAIWGYKKNLLFPEKNLKSLWLAMITVNLVVLAGSSLFLSIVVNRYALAVTTTILLAAPFVLAYLWQQWRVHGLTQRISWAFPVVIVLVLGLGVDGLDVFTDKRFIQHAGSWIKDNTRNDATLYSNNLLLIHYSGKDAYHENDNYSWNEAYKVIKSKAWTEYDYVAIVLRPEDYAWSEWLDIHLHGPPVKRIIDEHGNSALIYKNSG